mmetsp:Transcript_3672/g.4760  ORF Transcript_3672/g.4760 Transcript_3672/m.4760 type:complete len:303 (+) Transcript_3672:72-980(+)
MWQQGGSLFIGGLTHFQRNHFSLRSFCRNLSSFKYLEVGKYGSNDKVISVTFNRPDLRNAFNAEMIGEIHQAFKEINNQVANEEEILSHPKCVVLSGNGPTFSAGADLNWMREMADYTYDENIDDALKLYDMVNSIKNCKIPVIAKVNGPALGGGAGIVSAADMAIAISSAKFGFTEVKLGLIPAVISPFVLEKIGASNASRYFLTGEIVSAHIAKEISLVQSVAESNEELNATVDHIVQQICASSPAAVRASKELIANLTRTNTESERPFVAGEIAKIRVSKLGQEGLHSFLNKKKPTWME